MPPPTIPVLVPLSQSSTTRKKRPSFRPRGNTVVKTLSKQQKQPQLQLHQQQDQDQDQDQDQHDQNADLPSNAIRNESDIGSLSANVIAIGNICPESDTPVLISQTQQLTSDFNDNSIQNLQPSQSASLSVNDVSTNKTSHSTIVETRVHDSVENDTTTNFASKSLTVSVVDTTKSTIPQIKSRLLVPGSKRRTISLAKLDAKKRRLKAQGVAIIGATGVLINSSSPQAVTAGPIKVSEIEASSLILTQDSHSLDEEKSQKVNDKSLQTKTSSTSVIDLSHYPSIQLPPVIAINTSGNPTLSSFCSTFKIKKPRKKRQQQQHAHQLDAAAGTINNNINERMNNRTDHVTGTGIGGRGSSTNNEIGTTPLHKQGPTVQIVNGEIVLQESSLEYNVNDDSGIDKDNQNSGNNYYTTVVEEESQLAIINANYDSFLPEHRKRKNNWWSNEETIEFYKALRQVGLDFTTMEAYFDMEYSNANGSQKNNNNNNKKSRDRKQLKRKYYMELVRNPLLVESALAPNSKLEIDLSVFQLTEEEVQEVAKRRQQEKEEQERIRAAEAERAAAAAKERNENNATRLGSSVNDNVLEVVEEDASIQSKIVQQKPASPSTGMYYASRNSNISVNENATWSIFEDEPPTDATPEHTQNVQLFHKNQVVAPVAEKFDHNDDDAYADDDDDIYNYKDPLFASDDNHLGIDEEYVKESSPSLTTTIATDSHRTILNVENKNNNVSSNNSKKKKSKPNFRTKLNR